MQLLLNIIMIIFIRHSEDIYVSDIHASVLFTRFTFILVSEVEVEKSWNLSSLGGLTKMEFILLLISHLSLVT